MARPIRNNAEFFYHPASLRDDRRVKAIRSKFGIAGYGILLMLHEVLTDSDFTQLSTEELEMDLLAGDFGVSVTEINSLIQYAERIGFFTRNDAGNLICPDLNKALEQVFEKRNRSRNVAQQSKLDVSVTETPITATESTQKKVKDSKGKESKVKDINKKIGAKALFWSVLRLTTGVYENEKTYKAFVRSEEKKRTPQVPRTPPTIVTLIRQSIESKFEDYYWTAKDGAAAQQLVSKLKTRASAKKQTTTDEGIIKSFDALLLACDSLPAFYHFKDVPTLNSRFNEIITQLQTARPNGTPSNALNGPNANPYGQGAIIPPGASYKPQTFGRRNQPEVRDAKS